jgi:signal transduction histidine kinase
VGGEILGTLSLIWDKPGAFIADYALFKAIGQQIGIALHNARLYQDARQMDRLRMLNDLDRALQATLDPEMVAHVTLEHVTEALGAHHSTLVLFDGQPALALDPGEDAARADMVGASAVVPAISAEQIMMIKERLREEDASSGANSPMLVKHYPPAETASLPAGDDLWKPGDMMAPIVNDEGMVGLIMLRDGDRVFGDDDSALLRAAASRAGQALRNAHLYQGSQQQAYRLATLNAISALATASLEPEKVLEHILSRTAEVLEAEDGSILLTEDTKGDVVFAATVGHTALQGHRMMAGQGVVGWVVEHNQPALINNVQDDPRFYQALDEVTGFETRSLLCAPLRHRHRVTGVIEMVNKRGGGFIEEDLELLEAVASIASVALENARLYTRTRERAEELALLNEFNLTLASTLDFETVVDAALKQVRRLFQADVVSMLQPTNDDQALVVPQALVRDESLVISTLVPVDQSVSGWVYRNRRPLLIADFPRDARYNPAHNTWGDADIHAGMIVPLLMQGEAIGVVVVGHEATNFYNVTDLQTLQSLASTLAVAVQNAQLYENLRSLLRERERTQAHMIHTEKMAALGRLVASLAHEINNPLQAVQGCLTLAQEEFDEIEISEADQEAMAYYLTIAEDEIERISTIVRRMRDFYRPAREGTQTTNVHDVLDTILALSGKQLQHSNVDVVREWVSDPYLLRANPDHLKQVFLNLVLNAIDAMPDGGTLTIRTAKDHLVLAHGPTPALRIEFADTGAGIPPEVLPRIFEPFFTTKEQGSGLGLSISYSIIKAHHGEINIVSQPEKGTTFTILLPYEIRD